MLISINRTKPFNPSEFIEPGWGFWRGPKEGNGLEGDLEQDERSLALSEIDLSRVSLFGPEDNEMWKEDECLARIPKEYIRLDLDVFQTLYGNKSIIPQVFKERRPYPQLVLFEGQILRSPSGERSNLYLFIDEVGGLHFHPSAIKGIRRRTRKTAVLLPEPVVERPDFAYGQRMPERSSIL